VTDLVPKDLRVFPVGRLDYDTTGLLLLTNDGDLAYRMTHPRYHVSKVYLVRLEQELDDAQLDRLRRGVTIGRGESVRAGVERVPHKRDRIVVTVEEGRNRQIRRMLEAVGGRVKSLERTTVAGLRLGRLQRGEYRPLTLKEYNRLRKLVGLPIVQ
jgi:pseudouridine synthase